MNRSHRGSTLPVLHTDRPSGRKGKAAGGPEGNPYSFAHGLNFYKLVWIFTVGCLIGFVVETIWCYVQYGHFESRKGLIYGPLSPVYGFGAVLLTLTLYPLRNKNSLAVFAASAVIGAAFEFLCSWMQEKVFGTISWEYSDTPLNLGGRTNLQYAVFWGLLGLIFIKQTYPFLSGWIERIPNRAGKILTWVLVALLALDMLISSVAVKRWTNRSLGLPPANVISGLLDQLYPDDFMEFIYPNMAVVEKEKGGD